MPFFVGSIEDRPTLQRALEGVEAVVHLAARAHVMTDRAQNPLAEFRSVNVEGTRAVLEEAVSAGARRFVYVSTVKAVGVSNAAPWTEDVVPRPADPYGRSKLEAEKLVSEFGATGTVQTIILRLPLVYGPGMRGNMLQLFRLVSHQIPLPLGRANSPRSLAFSGNVVAAIRTVLESSIESSETFFVADKERPTTRELVRGIASALDTHVLLIPVPRQVARAVAWSNDVLARILPIPSVGPLVQRLFESLTVSTERFSRQTGYSQPFSLAEGLRETARWYQSQ
jgi:nucleoside-diphosphate-sugar epimerase